MNIAQKVRRVAIRVKAKIHRDFPLRRWNTNRQRRASRGKTESVLGHLLDTPKDFQKRELASPSRSTESDVYIWTLWLQGFHLAPEIVTYCQTNLKKLSPIPVQSIDLEKTLEIVNVPEDILRMHELGKVSNTKLSDLIRLKLLQSFGGIWLDSTVLVRDFGFFEQALIQLRSKDFAWMPSYKKRTSRENRIGTGGNWAMISSANSHWTDHMIMCFEKLLRETEGGIHYFDFFHIAASLEERCSLCAESFSYDNQESDYGSFHNWLYQEKFSKARLSWKESFMHKLSYKTFVFTDKHRDFLDELFESGNN